jgi:hypothetical protein
MSVTDEARRLFKQTTKPAPAMETYDQEQARIRANLERLRAERLAREAAAQDRRL